MFFKSFKSLANNFPLLLVHSPAVQFCLKHVSGEKQNRQYVVEYRNKHRNYSNDYGLHTRVSFISRGSTVQNLN